METCRAVRWETRIGRRIDSNSGKRGHFGSTATLVGKYIWVIGGDTGMKSIFTLDVTRQIWKSHRIQGFVASCHLHSACLFQDKLYLYGVTLRLGALRSSDDVIALDPVLEVLQVIPTFGGNECPTFRQSHTADVCEEMDVMAIFGGSTQVGPRQLYLLDFTSMRWSNPKSKGNPPVPRQRHASCMAGTILFIYNGEKPMGGDSWNDLCFCDLSYRKSLVWQHVYLHGRQAPGRIGPALAYVGSGRLIIFGGYVSMNNSSQLFVVDRVFSDNRKCQAVNPSNELLPAQTASITCTGSPPSAREYPRLVPTRGKVYVLGGTASDKLNYFELIAV